MKVSTLRLGILGLLIIALCVGASLSSQTTKSRASGSVMSRAKSSREVSRLISGLRSTDQKVNVILQTRNGNAGSLQSRLRENGVTVKSSFDSLGSISVEVPINKLQRLVDDNEVTFVTLDKKVQSLGHVTSTTGTENVRAAVNGDGLSYSVDGSGIGVAVIDSGIDSRHKAFGKGSSSRIAFSKDFIGGNSKDDYGHGTHVASEIAANSTYANGGFGGIAPKATLVDLRVLDDEGNGTTTSVLAALDWILTNRTAYNIRVVNMSLGTTAVDSYRDDPLCKAVRKLADAGVVVVTAAGNNGRDTIGRKIYGAIHSPGIEPSALTVGASNTFQTDVRSDDGVTTYSSRGPTRSYWVDESGKQYFDNVMKPEIVAPGNKIIGAQSHNSLLVNQYPELTVPGGTPNNQAMQLSGTSMSAPIVAGTVALMLQVNPQLTPNLVKTILMYTAQHLPDANQFEQGAGELNVDGAVRIAAAMRQDISSSLELGDPLMIGVTPNQVTTVTGQQFPWVRLAIFGHHAVRGTELISEYQRVYGLGMLLADGIMVADGMMIGDHTMMSDGIMVGDGIIIGDGIMLADGIMVSDGIMVGDGIMLADGIMVSDGVLIGDSFWADAIRTRGDQ